MTDSTSTQSSQFSGQTGELSGKVALVTGGSRGIGRAICAALAREGADVVVNFRHHSQEAEAVVAALIGQNRRAVACQADVGSAEDIVKLFQEIASTFGRLDILVNNAGVAIRTDTPIITCTDSDFTIQRGALEAWEMMLRVNVTGSYLCSQAAMPLLRASGAGRVINISSLSVITGGGPPGYVVSKAAVLGITRSLAQEFSPAGVTVNAIIPGAIATDMTPAFYPTPELIAQVVAKTPVGRYGQPEDIADAVAFLASPRAGFITGQMLVVDGGRSWSQRLSPGTK